MSLGRAKFSCKLGMQSSWRSLKRTATAEASINPRSNWRPQSAAFSSGLAGATAHWGSPSRCNAQWSKVQRPLLLGCRGGVLPLRTASPLRRRSDSAGAAPAAQAQEGAAEAAAGGEGAGVLPRSAPHVVPAPALEGRCGCGSVGWRAAGQSAISFVCHCSICRAASGQPALPAAGFKREQVTWFPAADDGGPGEGFAVRRPDGSRNDRIYCASCSEYMGEDATGPLGVVALPLSAAHDAADEYLPNHHIFYADRLDGRAVADDLPKWRTLPQGELLDNDGGTVAQNSLRSTASGLAQAASKVLHQREGGGGATREASTGRLAKDVLPVSPTRAPEPDRYQFTEADPLPNHRQIIEPEKVTERVRRKYERPTAPATWSGSAERERDVVIIGGGHNALTTAAYLSQKGLDVLVLERRHLVGGAAVTEELVPGYKFSRASYLAGLLRPVVIDELDLHAHGLKYLPRDPSSFTPSTLAGPNRGKHLMLGSDADTTWRSIAQFSKRDADAYFEYEEFLGAVREIVSPLLDSAPPEPMRGALRERVRTGKTIAEVAKQALKHRAALMPFYELYTAPASHILDRWFESEMLKTTLATDAVIGAMCSPSTPGSAYVLLHHVMGESAGKKGVWSYVEGGMGAVSDALASVAVKNGTEIVCNAVVERILYDGEHSGAPRASGVRMADGTEIRARKAVVAACGPYHTFLELLPGLARDSGYDEASPLPPEFQRHIRYAEHGCGAFKINCAVDRLPDFECCPSAPDGTPGPQHRGTIHFENRMEELEHAYREASMGMPATRPAIEMTIPSSLDTTVAPPGKHVVQLFVQYAPYDVDPAIGNWADPAFKEAFVGRCFAIVDEFCPGFSASVTGIDAISPLDLERTFGMHKGNIHHGSLSLHQLGYARPALGWSSYRTPMEGLYLSTAGAHPGGGVMGAAGRNAAMVMLSDLGLA